MLASRKITQRQLDSRVENVLDWAQKLARMSPDVIYGDDIETTHDNPETALSYARSQLLLLFCSRMRAVSSQ